MVHRQVLVTQILTHISFLLMLSLIMTSTFEHQIKHDVLSTYRKSTGIPSLKHQSCGHNKLFYFFQKIKMAKLAVFYLFIMKFLTNHFVNRFLVVYFGFQKNQLVSTFVCLQTDLNKVRMIICTNICLVLYNMCKTDDLDIYPLHTMFYMFFGFYNSMIVFLACNITFANSPL